MNTEIDFDKIFRGLKYSSELFEKYFDYQDRFLLTEIKWIKQELKERVKDLNLEEEVYWINMYNEFHLDYLNGTFPDIQNKSSMVILYNTFENDLKSLCKVLGESLKTPIYYYDLAGDDTIKCKKFLIKFCGINKDIFENDNWKKVDCIRQMRNCIVHNNSEISSIQKKSPNILKEFKETEGFVISDNRFGILDSNVLRLFLKIINMCYNDLENDLKSTQRSKMN